jgi:hypothetical protein
MTMLSRSGLAVCGFLFALSIGTPLAHAADFFIPPTNATLQWSPTNLGMGQYTNFCAFNAGKFAVTVTFFLETPGLGADAQQKTILPGQLVCGPQFSVSPFANADLSQLQVTASMTFDAPDACSTAEHYPRDCRVLASLEIAGAVVGEFKFSGTFTDRVHLEPYFLPFIPGRMIPIPTGPGGR